MGDQSRAGEDHDDAGQWRLARSHPDGLLRSSRRGAAERDHRRRLDRAWSGSPLGPSVALLRTVTPGTQEQAIRQARLLAEPGRQLKADQFAFLKGEWGCW